MKLGLLGARLGHSLSPQIHQEVFRRLGMEASYELIEVPAEKLADMLAMIEKGEISTTAGKTVLEEIIFSEKTATQVVEEKGLRQMNDTGALEQVVKDILAANPKVVEDYRGGKTNALGFLVGQCMRASKGKGNPNILREMLEKALNG